MCKLQTFNPASTFEAQHYRADLPIIPLWGSGHSLKPPE
jgi:hypothetical protein